MHSVPPHLLFELSHSHLEDSFLEYHYEDIDVTHSDIIIIYCHLAVKNPGKVLI